MPPEIKVSIVGMGYVGLTTAVCLSSIGYNVLCIDKDPEKVSKINRGVPFYYEKDLMYNLEKSVEKNLLRATTDFKDIPTTDITIISVGTPVTSEGMNFNDLKSAVKEVASSLKNKKNHCIVIKSSVLPYTTRNVLIPIIEEYSGKKVPEEIKVGVNPEFLREGHAVYDFLNPKFVVIGEFENDKGCGNLLMETYLKIPSRYIVERMSLEEAEFVKILANALASLKISFSNEIGQLCDKMKINKDKVLNALTLDKERSGTSYLRPGEPYGGSCLPKDTLALLKLSEEKGYPLKLIEAAQEVNNLKKKSCFEKCKELLGPLNDKTIAILGLSFKEGTDDIRESFSFYTVNYLLNEGARIKIFDPLVKSLEDLQKRGVEFNQDIKNTLTGADCCILMTGNEEFKWLDKEFDYMKFRRIIDVRGVLPEKIRKSVEYHRL